jgi:hypothetical protein
MRVIVFCFLYLNVTGMQINLLFVLGQQLKRLRAVYLRAVYLRAVFLRAVFLRAVYLRANSWVSFPQKGQ